MAQRIYLCIDLKSFFASVESVERGLDPFQTNLVVADPTRDKGTICLAITPAMKALGVKNRCRIFEIPKNIKYIVAKPRMKLYMDKSAEIYSIYLRYICADDILVYSIDECFIDATDYLKLYNKTPKELAKMLIDEVYRQTGIRATVGIGTNMFLTKVALDVTAKHAEDFIGYLDEQLFKDTIWHHKPITDIWNIGAGIAKRLTKFGIYDLYGVAHINPNTLYKEFGVNAELLIDHANGIEPCTIKDVHNYKSKSNSISNSQILFEDYSFDDAIIILKEMLDVLCSELIEKNLVTDNVSLYVSYSDKNEQATGGSLKLPVYTDSYKKLFDFFNNLYNKTTKKNLGIRKIGLSLNNIVSNDVQLLDCFTDYDSEKKERDIFVAVNNIKNRFGKNAIIKGISYSEKATGRQRNKMIGGHNGGEDAD